MAHHLPIDGSLRTGSEVHTGRSAGRGQNLFRGAAKARPWEWGYPLQSGHALYRTRQGRQRSTAIKEVHWNLARECQCPCGPGICLYESRRSQECQGIHLRGPEDRPRQPLCPQESRGDIWQGERLPERILLSQEIPWDQSPGPPDSLRASFRL